MLSHLFSYDPSSPLVFTQFYFWAFFGIVYAIFSLVKEIAKARAQQAEKMKKK